SDKGLVELSEGDSFYVSELKEDLAINAIENTRLLYVANSGVFEGIVDFHENLSELMKMVDAKDSYTYRHSINVMNYSLAILRKLNPGSSAFNDLTTASMFHDVGKIYIPIDVLNKPGAFTDQEYKLMTKHPIYSARLIAPKFGNKIATIAAEHHERLDGSGYPNGLKGDEICFESRIIAVADSFDAMTSLRTYKTSVKTPIAAAEELLSMSDKYDSDIAQALLELVLAEDLPIIMT
ncbi:MAG: HD domain-containing protein, partial [Oscillospiraceae bacterium]|nr:HD domain-containing protein [Oscillospiraceae bacterium]